jgi:UPF0755 protein
VLKNILYRAIITLLMTLIISISLIYFYLNERVETPDKIFIPRGSIAQIIAHINMELGNRFLPTDRYVIAYFGQPQSGWLQLPEENMRRVDFLKAITRAKAISNRITLYPGETTQYFIYSLANSYGEDFKNLYQYFLEISPISEGFLIPDTYSINPNIDKKVFIKNLVEHAKQIHSKRLDNYGVSSLKELKNVLTIASIIEKESGSIEEMPLVASVIFNRLKIGMKLQMDGTLNYGLYSHVKVTPERIREDNSHFNTYKIKGVPPSPICNPSFEAILAVKNRADTNYLFFMRSADKKSHIFTESYEDHLQAIERVKANRDF